MSARVRTVVVFKSEMFNTTERKPYFVNDCCFGDDLNTRLAQARRSYA
jgi:hypothetical protein